MEFSTVTPTLELSHVSFGYGAQRWAVNDLSVSLQPCRRVCLLGTNGAGKSTLLLLLNGTLRPCEGNIRVNGRAIDYSRTGLANLRREIGIVLQDPDDQLFAGTVEQDVAFGPLNSGLGPADARELVNSILQELEIGQLLDRPIHELSLGEKKRVAIAGALVLGPRILLLDEPTAGLDHDGVVALFRVLNRLHARDATILLTTHDTDLAYEWADDAWVLADGAIAARGPAVEVLTNQDALRRAGLRMPFLAAAALECRAIWPELEDIPLPISRADLFEQMRHGATADRCNRAGGLA
jgi:cobalt/nickel transport system ATP-binding protein